MADMKLGWNLSAIIVFLCLAGSANATTDNNQSISEFHRLLESFFDKFGASRPDVFPKPIAKVVKQDGPAEISKGIVGPLKTIAQFSVRYNKTITLSEDITHTFLGFEQVVVPKGSSGFIAPSTDFYLENDMTCFLINISNETVCFVKNESNDYYRVSTRSPMPIVYSLEDFKVSAPEFKLVDVDLKNKLNLTLQFRGWFHGDALVSWVSEGKEVAMEHLMHGPSGKIVLHLDKGLLVLEPNTNNKGQALVSFCPNENQCP